MGFFSRKRKREYTSEWLHTASVEEIQEEREKVRLDYCNPNYDDDYRQECCHTLQVFDRELSRRAWGNEKPHAPDIHREHGWYLPNDDD